MNLKIIFFLVNVILIYILVLYPTMKIVKINKEKLVLEKIQLNLKSILENKKKTLDTNLNLNQKIKIQKENKIKEEENLIFEGSYEVIQLLNNLSEKNNLTEDTIGRESNEQIEDKELGSFYYSCFGKEKDIFNLIFEIENNKKLISLKMDSVLLEKSGSYLELKTNIMYIINNKKQKIEYLYYKDEIFEKSNNRNIGTKRRKL